MSVRCRSGAIYTYKQQQAIIKCFMTSQSSKMKQIKQSFNFSQTPHQI